MKRIILPLLVILTINWGYAIDLSQVRFHNQETDTARITEILMQVAAQRLSNPGDRVVEVGRLFLDTPYVPNTLEGSTEMLTVNVDELDCTTFVDCCVAAALTLGERRTSWRDFLYNLEQERYRKGTLNGYPSRLHYIADWAVDNIHRGNLVEATVLFPTYTYLVRSLDFMSSNAKLYPALADSTNLAGIKSVEMGYRNHRFPYIKTHDVANKQVRAEFQNGDILAFIIKDKTLDVGHMGIVVMRDGVPYVMHASQSAGKVLITDVPLDTFLKRNPQFMGVRVFRLHD